MIIRVIYKVLQNNQVQTVSDKEAETRLRLGWIPEWDTPVVNLSIPEILFRCILKPQEVEKIAR